MKYILILLTLSFNAFALEIDFLTGYDGTNGKVLAVNEKISRAFNVPNSFFQVSGGTYHVRNFIGEKPGFFGEFAIGYRVSNKILFGEVAQGIALISKRTSRLNTSWQFPTSVSFGVRNDNGYVGIKYKHFSNGTANSLNRGADYIGLTLGLTLF